MNRLLRWALRNGWRRGVLNGSRPWLAAGGIALALRLVQRLAARQESVVYHETLGPGETIVIANSRPA